MTKTTSKFQFEGITDEQTVCDCCGKSNLKRTVVLKVVETGDFVHYGTTCAARAMSGRNLTASVAKTQIEKLAMAREAFDAQIDNIISAIRDRHISPRAYLKNSDNEIANGKLTIRRNGFEAVIDFIALRNN